MTLEDVDDRFGMAQKIATLDQIRAKHTDSVARQTTFSDIYDIQEVLGKYAI